MAGIDRFLPGRLTLEVLLRATAMEPEAVRELRTARVETGRKNREAAKRRVSKHLKEDDSV